MYITNNQVEDLMQTALQQQPKKTEIPTNKLKCSKSTLKKKNPVETLLKDNSVNLNWRDIPYSRLG